MDKKKELTMEFERYIKVLKNDIKRLEKELKESGDIKIVMGGDDNMSQMVLIPIKELFI